MFISKILIETAQGIQHYNLFRVKERLEEMKAQIEEMNLSYEHYIVEKMPRRENKMMIRRDEEEEE